MQLNLQIDLEKSNIFLELLNILKKDKMINDFTIIKKKSKKLNAYEKEILDDLSNLSQSIDDANNHRGQDKKHQIDIKF